MRIWLGLLACALLAAGPAQKLQLRCRLPQGTAWTTRGTVVVTTSVSEKGQTASKESKSNIVWQEKVVESDSIRGVTKETTVVEPEPTVLRYLISPRLEQRVVKVGEETVTEVGAMMSQPALFPLQPVAVGDSWELQVSDKLFLRGERAAVPADFAVKGTGTLQKIENGLAVLSFDFGSELRGVQPDAEGALTYLTTTTMKWTMGVDPATGFVTWQEMQSTSDQSVLRSTVAVGPTVRILTSMSLKSEKL
jgi:hypothetical protein